MANRKIKHVSMIYVSIWDTDRVTKGMKYLSRPLRRNMNRLDNVGIRAVWHLHAIHKAMTGK